MRRVKQKLRLKKPLLASVDRKEGLRGQRKRKDKRKG